MASQVSLTEIPTLTKLYRLRKLAGSFLKPNQAHNDRISVLQNDITTLKVDAIVNAANKSLLGGGGVDGAIHRAAGPGLLDECRTLDGCETGYAKITKGYNLPAKHVIHAVGPVYHKRDGELNAERLGGCYRTSLDLCKQHGLRSIAFSALSTGVYGYPSDEAAEVALTTVRRWLEQQDEDEGEQDLEYVKVGDDEANKKEKEDEKSGEEEKQANTKLERVIFCNFTQKDVDAYQDILPHIFPPTEKDHEEASQTQA
ncbi:MAG: hypothetical protein M1831_000335 [Alyxoria varia]|nr:MAG: hypothetical protein M1831_000335 [Alyxoria varia]